MLVKTGNNDMPAARRNHTAGETVMRGEFDQIARNLTARIEQQRASLKHLAAAHRSTREQKRKLTALAKALERIHLL
ncbi:MAG: hypothetical protein M3N38_06025, partial [Pseudomonadota bacterium]|nr:hypothetical protein [Pseudomonadota bacterium]